MKEKEREERERKKRKCSALFLHPVGIKGEKTGAKKNRREEVKSDEGRSGRKRIGGRALA